MKRLIAIILATAIMQGCMAIDPIHTGEGYDYMETASPAEAHKKCQMGAEMATAAMQLRDMGTKYEDLVANMNRSGNPQPRLMTIMQRYPYDNPHIVDQNKMRASAYKYCMRLY